MKVLLITDQHFGVRNDNQNFIDHYRKFYSEVVIPFVDANKIDTIINLGDTFDKRRSINFMSLDAAKEMWFDPLKERNVKMHMLIGNHDIYYKNTLRVNAPNELLGEYENIVNDHVDFDNKEKKVGDGSQKNTTRKIFTGFLKKKNDKETLEEKIEEITIIRGLTARYETWSLQWYETAVLVGNDLSLIEINELQKELKRISKKL